ncbi:MAG: phosphopentomutase [candidate division Zixibacteria bacterium]|nr:phosphopentomutase [candidate division Zixibacteria bacterium]NIT52716.1 phosphopentomutase [candidate division Zixibacteria bacterium]NIX59280.1 phosphopentomutase [candidate division Zixibacteria bacterium]
MNKFPRVILLILDACGIGELPDAADYGDKGANTICNIAKKVGGLNLPNMQGMGLGNIADIEGVPAIDKPSAFYGKMAELSKGKDSTVGHWELAGLVMGEPFPVFPDGFPSELIGKFERLSGFKVIGNKAASGTEIIAELGDEHRKTGKLIVYTSADSVFQIAAHTDVVSLEKLYEACVLARRMLTGEWGVSRVIARPFVGESGSYVRTSDRKDFSIEPVDETMLDKLIKAEYQVIGIGKIEDLFAGRGLTESYHTGNNKHGVDMLLKMIAEKDRGLIFINLVDFDMLWGHRNDYESFGRGLEDFDKRLPEILNTLNDDDLLIITADHGCDPTIETSTDHSREYVPLLVYAHGFKNQKSLGTRASFADVAQTICQNFNLEPMKHGKGFLNDLT